MKINENILPYLHGEKFDPSLKLEISQPENTIISRFSFIESYCKDKKVIHLGCCDHIPLIEEKIKNKVWLHKLILDVAKKCIGIDVNQEGVDFLSENLKISDVHCADITSENIKVIKDGQWDYLIMGEILEHINNPLEFMNKIKSNYGKNIKKVIITVPNAFAYDNFKFAVKHFELINSDHKYWFTPYTLSKILMNAGYSIDSFHFAQEIPSKIGLRAKLKFFPYIKRKYLYQKLKINPALRDTLIVIASF